LRLKSLLHSRWLIAAPALLVSLFSFVPSAEADGFGGWVYSQSCAASGSVETIANGVVLHGADNGGCSGQSHWVKIEATIPAGVNTVDFDWAYQTNDGAWYDPPQYAVNGNYIQLTMLNNDAGSKSVPVVEGDVFTFRQYSVDTCCQPGNLTITNVSLWVQSVTTTTQQQSAAALTTTMPESTTSTLSPSTTMGELQTTTTVQENIASTTSSSTTTSTTTTSTTTTSTTTTTTSTVPVTLYIPPTTTTEPSTTTTEPIPEPQSTTTTTVAEVTTTTENVTTTSEQPTPTTIPENPTTSVLSPPDEAKPALSNQELVAVLDALGTADKAEVQALVTQVLEKDLDTSQAASLVSSPTVLASVTSEQAVALFEEISPTELSPAEAEAVVEAVQSAPSSVRKAFESVLNIFQGFADSYVPLNSTVPVKTRRALIALSAVFLTVAPAPSRRNK